MRSNLNEIIVHRNETFTMDRYVVNADGSPYIVSDALQNPHIMIVVASNAYGQAGRYKTTWWLPLAEYPRFAETTPIDLDALVTTSGGSTRYCTDWPSGEVSAWLGTKHIIDTNGNRYVFVHTLPDGTKEYRYWDGEAYVQYDFQFEHIFTQEETREMSAGEYLYSIFLAAGETVHDTLHTMCQEYSINDEAMSDYERYVALEEKGVWQSRDFNMNAPIGTFSLMIPFLTPTKMSVISNLEGAM